LLTGKATRAEKEGQQNRKYLWEMRESHRQIKSSISPLAGQAKGFKELEGNSWRVFGLLPGRGAFYGLDEGGVLSYHHD
jgi:hypothetical protein